MARSYKGSKLIVESETYDCCLMLTIFELNIPQSDIPITATTTESWHSIMIRSNTTDKLTHRLHSSKHVVSSSWITA